jgi:hypothetical protein
MHRYLLLLLAACGSGAQVSGSVAGVALKATSSAARMRQQPDGSYLGYLAMNDQAMSSCDMDKLLEPQVGSGVNVVLSGGTLAVRLFGGRGNAGRYDLLEPSVPNTPFVQAFFFHKTATECVVTKAQTGFIQFKTASEKHNVGSFDLDFGTDGNGQSIGRLHGTFDVSTPCSWSNAFPVAVTCQ